jgi:hypothetical protein
MADDWALIFPEADQTLAVLTIIDILGEGDFPQLRKIWAY